MQRYNEIVKNQILLIIILNKHDVFDQEFDVFKRFA